MLEVRNITKSYEKQPLLRGISFEVKDGQTVCLLGASGSGKSTLLRIISGIETPESGQVLWDGIDITHVPVHKRNFGLMFQDYALFPHKNVFENVAFGLRMQQVEPDLLKKRVDEVLEMVNLTQFANRRVTDLSGGEQQRVALARALAPNPRLLMFDEPLGALDRTLREELLIELRELLHATRIPAIYVTHDQEEAFAIGQQIILTNHGKIVQQGTPEEVYHKPNNAWVARFLGQINLLPAKVKMLAPMRVTTVLGEFAVKRSCCDAMKLGDTVMLLSPPNAMQSESEGVNILQGVLDDVVFRGQNNLIVFRKGNITLQFNSNEVYSAGEELRISLNPLELLCLEKEA